MRLIYNSFVAVATVALSAVAGAQATQPSTTTTTAQQPVPDEPNATAPGQTQSTPGQSQTTPGQASQTTPAETGQMVPAKEADLKSGLSVYDQKGGLVGKIESVSSKGAVVSTGKTRATIPVSSFGKSDKGLAIAMTKDEIDAAAKKSSPKPK
jgi:hypothetical protein